MEIEEVSFSSLYKNKLPAVSAWNNIAVNYTLLAFIFSNFKLLSSRNNWIVYSG